MRRLVMRTYIVGLAAVLLLTGCQGNGAGSGGASKAIEAYLQARATSDLDQMTLLSCAEWEPQARVEASTFQAMNATLEGVTCAESGTDGDYTLVACQGKIVTTYQGETREWSVADHPFRAKQDGGEWRMCGYGE